MKKILTLVLLMAVFVVGDAEAQKLKSLMKKAESALNKGGLSQEDAGNGLKEALNAGVGKAVDFLSAEDGYYKSAYKILLPEEAQKVTNKLKSVPGFQNAEEKVIEKINRAAEDAAVKAKPIFVSAIKQMTFKDAMNILLGNKDAATRYLEKATYDQLYTAFKPIIVESLDKFNAREYWRGAVNAHNKVPFVKKANPELDDYVTKQALGGMFGLIEVKEKDIRGNESSRTTDLMRKVFAKQD
ncbi:MAG: DUF4197 domain-containing protein [Bacteroidota bacterium]